METRITKSSRCLSRNKCDAFVYNAIYRLTGVKYGVPNLDPLTGYDDYLTFASKEGFNLDGVGNRLQVTNGTTVTYQPNQLNQYTAVNSQSLTYDLNGNTTFDGYNTITCDYANRPVKFENTTYIVEVTYDALGRRLQKMVTNKITLEVTTDGYVLDGARVICDTDSTGAVGRNYVWGNGIDELLATAQGGSQNFNFYLQNSLGSVTHITNRDGEIEESYRYTAYGTVTIYNRRGEVINHSIQHNRYMFTGREYDIETGLYYYRARYYSAGLGRFLQRDVELIDRLFNYYVHTGNNPINYKDPFGKEAGPGDIAPRPDEIAKAKGDRRQAESIAAERYNREQKRVDDYHEKMAEKLEAETKERHAKILRVYNKLQNTINTHRDEILNKVNELLSQSKCKTTLPTMPDVAESILADIWYLLFDTAGYIFEPRFLYSDLIVISPLFAKGEDERTVFLMLAHEWAHVTLQHSNILPSEKLENEANKVAGLIRSLDP